MTKQEAEALFSSMSPEDQDKFINDLSAEENAQFQALLAEPKPKEDNSQSTWGMIGQAIGSPTTGPRPSGLSPKEFAEQLDSTRGKAIDLATGGAQTRMAIGASLGARWNPEELRAMLQERELPSGSDVLDKSRSKLTGVPRAIAATGIDLADPGALIGGAGALKNLVKGSGRRIYGQALKRADVMAGLAGKEAKAVSDVLLKNRVTGGNQAILDKTVEIVNRNSDKVDDIVERATKAGLAKDPAEVLGRSVNEARAIVQDKTGLYTKSVKDQAQSFLNEVEPILTEAAGGWSAQGIQNTKRTMQGMAGDSAYATLARTNKGSKLFKEAGYDTKVALEDLAEQLQKGGGAELAGLNAEMAPLLTSRNVLKSEAMKEGLKGSYMVPSQVDALAAATTPLGLALKKGQQILYSPEVLTRVGDQMVNNPAVQRALAAAVGTIGVQGTKNIYQQLLEGDGNGNNQ